MITMARPSTQNVVFLLVLVLLAIAAEAARTPPGIANNPSNAVCKDPTYKECQNLVHVCPKFCPDSCHVHCQSCKPICGPEPPSLETPTTPTPYPPTTHKTPPTPKTPAPVTPSPSPPIPVTPPTPTTPAPVTSSPSPPTPTTPTPTTPPPPTTPAPVTPSPTPTTPVTPPTPTTPSPSPPTPTTPTPKSPPTPTTPAPVTPSPPTPTTPAPVTPSPSPPTPITPAPETSPTPTTPAQVTPSASPPTPTPAPATPSPPSPTTPTPYPPTPTTPAPVSPSPPTPTTPTHETPSTPTTPAPITPSPPSPTLSPPSPTTPAPYPPTPVTPSPPTPTTPTYETPSTPTTPAPVTPSPPSPTPSPPSPTTPAPYPPTPTTPTPVTPSPPTPTRPTPETPPTPTTPAPSPADSGEVDAGRRRRCHNRNYSQCYGVEHRCPSSCPYTCLVDCVTCKPVCTCDMPGAVCQDPRFIGGDGITFYFHGKKGQDFCLVTDQNLHINAHFIGKRNKNMKRDFTWIQSIGILFGNHKLFLGAQKAATWDNAVDHLALSFDGEPIVLPTTEGATWQSESLSSAVVKRDGDTNSLTLEVDGLFKISAKVVPITKHESDIHNYGITDDDSFAHLELGFKFNSLSGKVNGVLGQTYQSGYVSRAKMGVAMPVLGGEQEFKVSNLFATDCSVSQFERRSLRSVSGFDMELPDMKCSSGINGKGVVCKR